MQDWAQGVQLVEADVDAERAVVLEELRLGKGAQDRMRKLLLPKVFGDSLHAKRPPIGNEASLKGFKFEALQRFYKDWYRPDLMAVIVVGDIAVDDAKALVQRHFAALKNPTHPRPRNYPALSARATTEAFVVTDHEATHHALELMAPVTEVKPARTLADYRQEVLEQLFGMALQRRIQELTQQANPPFLGASSGLQKLTRGYRYFGTGAVLGRAGMGPALDALVLENRRVRQFGFEAAELERSKKDLLRIAEQAYAERDKTYSARYVAEYVQHFVESQHIAGAANELQYLQEMLPTIGLGEVNGYARATIPDQQPKLLVHMGSNKEAQVPTEVQLLTALRQAEQQPVVAKAQKVLPTSLMAKAPQAGRVLSETKNEALGTSELKLSNGLRVILKPTDFKSDEILISADRLGGQSLYGQADKFNAAFATRVVDMMGLAEFTPTDLSKMLAGKVAKVGFSLDSEVESIRASSSRADLETTLQLLHLKFAAPRRDPDLFNSFVTRMQDDVKNLLANPQVAFSDLVLETRFNAHPRVLKAPRPADIAQVSLDRVTQIYQERFSSAKGFSFVIVGSFSRETLDPLIVQYLASLPTPELATQYKDMGIRTVPGAVQKTLHAGTEPKSMVTLWFAGDAPYTQENRLAIRALADLLNIRFIDELREAKSLIYGGNTQGQLMRTPYPHYRFALQFPCAPENAEKVIAGLFAEIEKVQTHGPVEADLAKVKQNWLVADRQSLRENTFWRAQLQTAALFGDAPEPLLLDLDKHAQAVGAAQVQAAARNYLRRDQYVQVVLYPK